MPIGKTRDSGRVLTPRDHNILKQLAENYILTTEQIFTLFFQSYKTCRNRLIDLRRVGWLTEVRPFHFNKNSTRIIKLGKLACKTFQYPRCRGYTSAYVDHQLGINEINVQLVKHGILKKYQLAWQDGSKFTLPYEQNYLRPDARILHPVSNLETYLEFDRGTKNLLTISDNIAHYLTYYDEKDLRSKDGQKGVIQVIYITPEQSRAKSIEEQFGKLILKQNRKFLSDNWVFLFRSFWDEDFYRSDFSFLDYQKVLVDPCSKIEQKKSFVEIKPDPFWDQVPPQIRSKIKETME